MQVEKVSISKLNPAKYNPRKDLKPGNTEYEKLKRSMAEFGYVEPIIWNKRTGNIVGGHQRYKILKDMKYKEAECVIVDLDDNREKALNVALNKISGEFDIPLLTDLLKDLSANDFDVSLTGFDEDEISDLFSDADAKEGKDDDYDVNKALEESAFVKQGDLWQIGKHRMLCGDATNSEDLNKLMGDKKANLIVTDPPYNVNFESASGLKIKNDKQTSEKFYDFLLSAFKNISEHLAEGGSAYIFHADTEGLNFRKAFIDAGFHLSGVCIWAKNSFVMGRSPYQWGHEPILYGWLKTGKHKWYAGRAESTIWHYDKPKKNGEHPTMKPIPLLCYPIKNSSAVNSIVLDTFAGSGSTLMACQQMDRICYCMEIDPKYASVIIRRYVDSYGDENVFLVRENEKIPYSKVIQNVKS
nr:MAG TPA: adenine specific DNA methyltransferase [Caudoviricetes sp.]